MKIFNVMLRNTIVLILCLFSQAILAHYTPEQFYNADASAVIKGKGYVRTVLRETKNSYFVLLLDKSSGRFSEAKKAWIHKFDIETLQKTGEIELFSIDKDASKFSLEKIFSNENGITVILKKASGNNVTYDAQSFNHDLSIKRNRTELLSYNE